MNENIRLLLLANLLLFSFWAASYFILIPVPLNLIVSATSIVFIGAHRSLKLVLSEEDGGMSAEDKETLTVEDAYKFPIIGSAALFSLYFVFKYFDKDTVNLVLSIYFSVIGVFTLTSFLCKFIPFGEHKTAKRYGFKTKLPLLGDIDCLFTPMEMLYSIISIIFSVGYFKTKHFMLNNIFGIVFCIHAIERISIGSYKIGAVLLIGLFFYDIFWVFGTEVMVTVAKSFDGPIKLLFPTKFATADEKGQFSLLGLGDIVIPGLFVALLLRFDAVRANIALKHAHGIRFPKPYFLVNIVCYALGLVTTVAVMYFFKAAQPALLYLVPACLGGSLIVALVRGEFTALFQYNEEHDEKKKDEKATEGQKETKKEQ